MQFNARLDNKQNKAITSKNRNTLIVAAPGSGKTTVIINRTYYLISEEKLNPNNIAVITFTKASALDMERRYKLLIKGISTTSPYFGTLHSFFYNIIRREYGNIKVIEEKKAHDIIENTVKEYVYEINEEKIKEIINYISIYKCSGERFDFSPKFLDMNVFNQSYIQYELYKKQNNLLDFDDIQIRCRDLLLNDESILNKYKNIYKYILVDEFQDCDSLQLEILKLLNGKTNSIFAVGDEDQSIYGFRDARPDYMVDFEDYFEDSKKIFLSMNYRSMMSIVTISNNLISNNLMRNKKDIQSCNKIEANINVKINEDEKSQSQYVINKIKYLTEKRGYRYNDCAVLYRTNIERLQIINTCISNEIPFKILGESFNFYYYSICEDILSYLRLSFDLCDKKSFARIINKPYRYISKLNIEKVINNPIKEDCFSLLKKLQCNSTKKLKEIDCIKKNIVKLKNVPLNKVMHILLNDLHYEKYIYDYCTKNNLDQDECIKIINIFDKEINKFDNLCGFLNYVGSIGMNSEEVFNYNTDDKINLSTIHGIKGMEFKNVFIINCNEENIPYVRNGHCDLESERRLFYVAITRAIENVYICTTKRFKSMDSKISRFILECGISNAKLL